MFDIIKAIKKQSEKQIAELHDLTGKLSGQLKALINLIPDKTRAKTVDSFLNDIRQGVFGEAPARRRGRKPGAKKAKGLKRGRKPKAAEPKKRGRKKKAVAQAPAGEGRGGIS